MSYFGSVIQDMLKAKYKGCEYACGETYESLVWMDSNSIPKPTEEQIVSDIEDYKANQKKYDWEMLRNKEYPDVKKLLLLLWESMDSGEIPKASAFYNAIKTVHDKFPKPG